MPQTRAMAVAQVAGPSHAEDSRKMKQGASSKPAPRKRTRTNKDVARAPKRGKPSLKRILDMPPEVFNEIAIHLMPVDLLSLARSNKFFRNIFMSRSSHHLWRAAFSHLPGLPPCPSDLSEPQYASLLFSKTCSSCGARVLRRMDPFLHVRLCNPCRDEQIAEIWESDDFLQLVPRSDVIKAAGDGFMYTLRSEYQMVRKRANGKQSFFTWRETRAKEMDEWHERADELEMYLDRVELDRESELEDLKEKRVEDIETRLVEKGWTKRDAITSPENAAEWNKLVWQPKPMTDRIWNNLYPKLVPMLESNRAYHERVDKEQRQQSRIIRIGGLVTKSRLDLPPLVHVTLKHPPESEDASEPSTPESNASESSTSESSTSESNTFESDIADILDLSHLAPDNIDVKAERPFPTMAEFLAWPMVKSIVENDTSADDAERSFNDIREEFSRAVVEWRDKIEQDLIDKWNAGQPEDHGDEMKSEPSVKKGKGKAVARAGTKRNTRKTQGRASMTKSASTGPSHDSIELVLPELVVTFTKPDGTTTTDISELSPNMQTLLRADTMFQTLREDHTYPALLPPMGPFKVTGAPDRFTLGEHWSVSDAVTRDLELSGIAKEFLARTGRPDATSVEMRAIGSRFKCGRCVQTLPQAWEDLVHHYGLEQKRWKQAQVIMKGNTKSQFAFHNIHELEQSNAKPFAQLITTEAVAESFLESAMHERSLMVCKPCESMGVDAKYHHIFHTGTGIQSPMVHHLRDVHDIEHAIFGLHFVRWFVDPEYLADVMELGTDEEDYDSEDPWEWGDY
ncbi:hypothetical protein FRC12_006292 [Ceratobasidium sp. 428]|nr:hypothetical protein FRC12_006292 [Ceratobasidium sp. 428]